MNSGTQQSTSVWMATSTMPETRRLEQDQQADVCVVGAGIAGLSTAYMLAREGQRVVVLDDGPIGGEQTRHTTAHLSNAIDDRLSEIEKVHGQEGARLAAESHGAAIDRIEQIAREEGIDCDFLRLDGYLFTPPGHSDEVLQREFDAAHRAGLSGVEMLPRAPLESFDTGHCLRFPRQGQFHPLKYLAGLVRGITARGGQVFSGAHVVRVEGGSEARVETSGGRTVTARAVVVATNTPINDRFAIHTKQAPYSTYAIGARIPRGAVTPGLYWDTLEFYHYVRVQPIGNEDILIIGGEDHKSGQADDQHERHDRLQAWGRERFPMMGSVVYRWSGMVMETLDGLGYIGRNPMDADNVYIITGDSGMGMTHGTIGGILITDLILGRENPWAQLYDPSRTPAWGMAGKEFLVENLNVAKQYGDLLTGGEVSSEAEIGPGRGAVIRRGTSKIAAYRDEQGALHECSAICTHLGCVVHFNDVEKTWDCPCHGSRFDTNGQVVNGPATRPLEPVSIPAEHARPRR